MALEDIAHMEQGKVIPLDGSLAIDAAQHGVDHKLPLADSMIYATARKYDALIWTQDIDFKLLEGVKYYSKKKQTRISRAAKPRLILVCYISKLQSRFI